jgi:uncharacterized paraquat-inducible protein A
VFVPNGFPAVILAIVVFLALAGVAGYLSIRLAGRRSDNTVVMGLFMLAAVFGIVAIFTLTFLRKAVSG